MCKWLSFLAGTGLFVALSAPAQAETLCTSIILNRVVADSLRVPAGANCQIGDSTIVGGISVDAETAPGRRDGGRLTVSGSTLEGFVQALDGTFVSISGSSRVTGGLATSNARDVFLNDSEFDFVGISGTTEAVRVQGVTIDSEFDVIGNRVPGIFQVNGVLASGGIQVIGASGAPLCEVNNLFSLAFDTVVANACGLNIR